METKAVLILTIAALALVRANDIQQGTNSAEGHQILNENVVANPTVWRQNKKVSASAPENEIISHILVTDNRELKDGDAKIIEGGLGEQNVTIELQSPTVLRGFDFHVEVHAVPDTDENRRKVDQDKVLEEQRKANESFGNPDLINRASDNPIHPRVFIPRADDISTQSTVRLSTTSPAPRVARNSEEERKNTPLNPSTTAANTKTVPEQKNEDDDEEEITSAPLNIPSITEAKATEQKNAALKVSNVPLPGLAALPGANKEITTPAPKASTVSAVNTDITKDSERHRRDVAPTATGATPMKRQLNIIEAANPTLYKVRDSRDVANDDVTTKRTEESTNIHKIPADGRVVVPNVPITPQLLNNGFLNKETVEGNAKATTVKPIADGLNKGTEVPKTKSLQ